jgi:hypothetical protein
VRNDNEDEAFARDLENCTLWINQPVDWTSFLTNASSQAKDEDLKKELQTIHGWFLHVDPIKRFGESASAKEEKFAPFCILASCYLARADSGAFQEYVCSMAGVNLSTRQTNMIPESDVTETPMGLVGAWMITAVWVITSVRVMPPPLYSWLMWSAIFGQSS